MKTLQIYDYAMAANGTFVLPVSGNYFRIITTTGNVNVIGDTWGKLGPISRGQGLENSLYNRLTIQDASGSANAGTILVSDANFIDQTLYGSISLAGAVAIDSASQLGIKRAEAQTGFFSDNSALTANTPLTVFAPGSNPNGAILLSADSTSYVTPGAHAQSFLTKSSAPTTVVDGSIVLLSKHVIIASTVYGTGATLPKEQFIAAGQGLYFISNVACPADAFNYRACRYKLL